MEHYTITIKVAYDETTTPDHLEARLYDRVTEAISEGLLTPTYEEVVDEYSIRVSFDGEG